MVIPQPSIAAVRGDNWRGVTDPKTRRTIQNRCNQRAARRRRRETTAEADGSLASKNLQGPILESPTTTSEAAAFEDAGTVLSSKQVRRIAIWIHSATSLHGESDFACDRTQQVFASVRRQRRQATRLPYHLIEAACWSSRALEEYFFPLPADHLLSLVYYNVYRGILQNIAILGLDLDLMEFDDYPSPFLPLSASSSSAIFCPPPQLAPTALQKTIAHHPQIDIFPDPVLRDNFVRLADNDLDDDEFCHDMVGSQARFLEQPRREPACRVWGEAWRVENWEVSEWFVRKYSFLFAGATDFERGTNHWRQQRGLEPICFANIIQKSTELPSLDLPRV